MRRFLLPPLVGVDLEVLFCRKFIAERTSFTKVDAAARHVVGIMGDKSLDLTPTPSSRARPSRGNGTPESASTVAQV